MTCQHGSKSGCWTAARTRRNRGRRHSRLYGIFAQRVHENRQSYRPIVQRHSGRAACCVVRLPVLADTLGIDLELEAEEKAVGPFRADIVARRPDCAAAMRAAGREAGTPPRRRRSSSFPSVTTMSQKSSVMQLPQFVPKALTSDIPGPATSPKATRPSRRGHCCAPPLGYGRNAHCCAPPAQIRTWSLNHPAPTSGA